ncbi:putative cytochrome P450 [Xylariaceae sp. FL0016]|nr:putative cytochrome P450 [Xylariaceae sp. FL0016]
MFTYTPLHLAGALLLIAVAFKIAYSIYLLWLHPMSKYPGPKLAAVSELWYARSWTSGDWHKRLHEAHKKYGDIVRIAPNELSFATMQSFKDIYGPPSKTRKLFPKSDLFYDVGVRNLVFEMDPNEHAKLYKLFAPAFRTSALRSQEHVIHEHMDIFLNQLRRLGTEGGKSINIAAWLEWLTFDIIGQLTFGESFHEVANAKPDDWTKLLLGSLFGGSILNMQKRLRILKPIVQYAPWLSPSVVSALGDLQQHYILTLARTRRRIAEGPVDDKTQDFFTHVLQHGSEEDKNGLSLSAHATLMLTAGAETSAHALGSACWFLAQPSNAKCMKALQDEVRGAFEKLEDITGDRLAPLPYLNAVLEETMRVMPPSPVGPPRVSPGETVDGVYVPAGTYVSADLWSIHHDPRNTPQPWTFDPSRWLGSEQESESEKSAQGKRRPFSVPFLIGPRMCIGVNLAWMEMRIVLAKLVWSFDWSLENAELDLVNESKLFQLWLKMEVNVKLVDARRQ